MRGRSATSAEGDKLLAQVLGVTVTVVIVKAGERTVSLENICSDRSLLSTLIDHGIADQTLRCCNEHSLKTEGLLSYSCGSQNTVHQKKPRQPCAITRPVISNILHLRGSDFKSRHGHRLPSLSLFVFTQALQSNAGTVP